MTPRTRAAGNLQRSSTCVRWWIPVGRSVVSAISEGILLVGAVQMRSSTSLLITPPPPKAWREKRVRYDVYAPISKLLYVPKFRYLHCILYLPTQHVTSTCCQFCLGSEKFLKDPLSVVLYGIFRIAVEVTQVLRMVTDASGAWQARPHPFGFIDDAICG